jgi:hypothetical protein
MDKQKIIDNYYDLYQNALHWIKSMRVVIYAA